LRRYGATVDVLNYLDVSRDPNPLVKLTRKTLGLQFAQALSTFFRMSRYDAIFSYGEGAGAPVAMVLMLARLLPWLRRPRHVGLVYDVTKKKTLWFFRWLRIDNGFDMMLLPSEEQRRFCIEKLGIKPERTGVQITTIDARFFTPPPKPASTSFLVVSAGANQRDHGTLVRAAAKIPDVKVRIEPSAGPRMKKTAFPDVEIPSNVEFVSLEPGAIRDLYVRCDVVGVSVLDSIGIYGITTALEGMAMGKPVIMTRNSGLAEYFIEEETAISVPAADVEGWVAAIRRLRDDAPLRDRLGANARKWVEQKATLEHWVERIVRELHVGIPQVAGSPSLGSKPQTTATSA
jgi:glycosyltransferase involved in cell wall biosynthesis